MFENHFWKAAAAAILALAFIGCNGPSTPGGGGEPQEPDELTASIVPYSDTEGDGSLMEIGDRLVFSLAASEAVQTVLWTTDNPQVLAIEAYPTDGAGPATQISAARIRAQGVSDGSATLTATATAADGRTATASLEIEVAYRVYVVTLNFRDGSPNAAIRVREDATMDTPEQPTRVFDYSVAGLFSVPIPDFVFDGWHLGDEAFDFDTPITANITLDAQWIAPDPIDLSGQPGDTIAHRAFDYVYDRPLGTNYALVLDADVSVAGGDPETGTGGLVLWEGGNLSLHGAGGQREIGLSSPGYLILVGEGSRLTLSGGITLRGIADNDTALVRAINNATLVMRAGSVIRGNTNTSQVVNHWGFNGFFGGGVFVAWAGSSFYMEGGEIHGNTALAQGGGVEINDATFTMTGGRIRDNSAVEGGGVRIGYNGTFVMEGGEITGNTVFDNNDIYYPDHFDGLPGLGGGVSIGYNGTVTMKGGNIRDNNSSFNGGGVNIGYSGTLNMEGGHVRGNNATNFGGGVSLGYGGTFIMSSGAIHDNTATGYNLAGSGGGVFVSENANFEMTRGTIHGNTAVNGGGVTVARGGAFLMEDGQIRDNIAHFSGGGVFVSGYANFEMTGGTIHGNTAGNGGGVSLHISANLKMAGGTIRGNTADNGGGVDVGMSANFEMTGGTIHGNTAGNGGGVDIGISARFKMAGGTIRGNTADNGGGVSLFSNGRLAMNGGQIRDNIAHFNGGGVNIDTHGIFAMAGGEIAGNEAYLGGGVFVPTHGTFLISSGLIHGSDAAGRLANTVGSGGAALFAANNASAHRGTFPSFPDDFEPLGGLETTDDTISLTNGQ